MIRVLNETKSTHKKDRKAALPALTGKSVKETRRKLKKVVNGSASLTKFHSKKGKEKFESISLTEGKLVYSIGRGMVENRLRTEASPRHHEEIEKTYKDMESFSCSLSHELREPLLIIDWFSREMIKKYGHKLDAEGVEMLSIINETSSGMTRLITNLLSFAGLNLKEIHNEPVDMKVLAEKALDGVRLSTRDRNVQIGISDLPGASGDSSMIFQVLVNLLSNALKYTRPREKAKIEIGGYEKDGESVYYVKDNGVGFSPRHANKLFGFFQRLHSPEEFEGCGLGLVITKRIIEKHGGRVWAKSRLSRGATFFFSLPGR
jgi:light-regulated signal transduction histidine kinase (bacteriophytochrome)